MDLSIIIVNWNSKHYLESCIESISNSKSNVNFEIIVIDSGSFDGCDAIVKQFPSVRFIQSKKNVGFARANNEAFNISSGRNILFLNPDTEIVAGAIDVLFNAIEARPDAGVVGPKILNSNGTIQTSCVRAFPNILNQILDTEILMTRFSSFKLWGMTPRLEKMAMISSVEAISGACLMVKRTIFKNIGLFSVEYFMYSEDIDLCYKIKKAGWNIYYVPDALIVHHGGGSSEQNNISQFANVMMVESRWRYFRKNRSVLYGRTYRFTVFSMSILRIVIILLIWPILRIQGKHDRLYGSLKKWKARLRWTIGFENWVKNY